MSQPLQIVNPLGAGTCLKSNSTPGKSKDASSDRAASLQVSSMSKELGFGNVSAEIGSTETLGNGTFRGDSMGLSCLQIIPHEMVRQRCLTISLLQCLVVFTSWCLGKAGQKSRCMSNVIATDNA
jgi:hypothetical protein